MNVRTAALYIRTSTQQQTSQNQVPDLERMVRARGYEPRIYAEVESAARARPVLDQLLADARTGRIQGVAVWALDRLHRSMVGAIQTVLEFDRLGVAVISLREPWLDTAGPVRSLLVAIFGWVAEQERERLRERTKAGMERARRQGKRIGRPRTPPLLLAAAAADVEAGLSQRAACRKRGVSQSALREHMRRA